MRKPSVFTHGAAALLLMALLTLAGCASIGRLSSVPPATWPEIYTLTATETAKLGPDYVIEQFSVKSAFNTSTTDEGPTELTILAHLHATREDPDRSGWYRTPTLTFSDRAMRPSANDRSWTNRPPPTGTTTPLSRVTISPRDVYKLTWQDAHRTLAPPVRPASVSMALLVGPKVQLNDKVESVWVVTYYNDTESLEYRIDAQTGKILEKKRF